MTSKAAGLLAAILFAAVAVAACDDPRDPQSWVKKLGDIRQQKEAVRQLVKLKDPVAVTPLINLFKITHDPTHLEALLAFEDPASVEKTAPVLVEALDYSEDSYDNARTAAEGLGRFADKLSADSRSKAVEALARALDKPLAIKSRANVVKSAAIRALTKLRDPRGIDVLIRVVQTSADEQDFYLNMLAARALGELRDPKAVPALVRGLFMTGRGTVIYPQCRVALVRIGEPAIDGLVTAFEEKDPVIQKMAVDKQFDKYTPGVVPKKAALVLGDLRARKALPNLLARLRDDKVHKDGRKAVLYALGMIADPATVPEVVKLLKDSRADWNLRVGAAEALNLMGARAALPALLEMAKSGYVVRDGYKYHEVRIAAAMAYSRLGGAEEYARLEPIAKAEAEEPAKSVFAQCLTRLAVAKQCKQDVACYAQVLASPSGDADAVVRHEKAAFALALVDEKDRPVAARALWGSLAVPEQIVRLAVLHALGRVGGKCAECQTRLGEVIGREEAAGRYNQDMVNEMQVTLAVLGRL